MDVLKDNALFLKEFHHHTELSIVLKMNLDYCGITVFVVVRDNAANMKSAFTMELDQVLNPDTQSDVSNDLMKMRTMIHLSYNHISG